MSSNGPSSAFTLASPELLAYRLCTVNATTTAPRTLGFACTAAQGCARGAPASSGAGQQSVAVEERLFGERQRREYVDAECPRVRGGGGAHVHVGVVDGEHRIGRAGRDSPARQVRRLHGDHAGDRAFGAEYGHAVTLELLVEQRIRGPGPHAAQQQVSLAGDVPDHVAHFVQRALQQALGSALAEREGDVAGAIACAAGEQGEERVGHRLLEPRDGGYGGDAERKAVEVAL